MIPFDDCAKGSRFFGWLEWRSAACRGRARARQLAFWLVCSTTIPNDRRKFASAAGKAYAGPPAPRHSRVGLQISGVSAFYAALCSPAGFGPLNHSWASVYQS